MNWRTRANLRSLGAPASGLFSPTWTSSCSSPSSSRSSVLSPNLRHKLWRMAQQMTNRLHSSMLLRRRVVFRTVNRFFKIPNARSITFRVRRWASLNRPLSPSGSPGNGGISQSRHGYAESPRMTAWGNGRWPNSNWFQSDVDWSTWNKPNENNLF